MTTQRENTKACLIVNPTSGQGETDSMKAKQTLMEGGWDVQVLETQHPHHATELTRAAAQAGCDVVVACGGDGTLNEVIEGALDTDVTVGVVPGGTANVWARELGIALDPQEAAKQLIQARRHRIDVGQVELSSIPEATQKQQQNEVLQRRHFLLMAGIGFDGAVMENVSPPLKKKLGPIAVGLAAVKALPSFEIFSIEMKCYDKAGKESTHWSGEVAQIVVGNTRQYAGFAEMTNQAYVDDGLLDICLITATTPLSVIQQLGALLLLQRPQEDTAEFYRGATIAIQTTQPLPVQIDGETIPDMTQTMQQQGSVYTISALHQAITVLVPQEYKGPLFQRRAAEKA